MYKGKHLKPSSSRKKPVLLLTSLILLVTLSVAGTLAYLIATTSDVKNTFSVATVPIEVVEDTTTTPGVKNDVTIKNIGSADAYIRATVVANWVDSEGNVYGAAPKEGTDYNISWNQNGAENPTGWVKYPADNGYYYYPGIVSANGSTSNLFTNCALKEGVIPPAGYTLSIEVLAQSIQASGQDSKGNTPAALAWGVEISSTGVSSKDIKN